MGQGYLDIQTVIANDGLVGNVVPTVQPPNIPGFPGTLLSVGSTGSNVRLIQEAINRLADVQIGLSKVAVDGFFGNETRDAVIAFQFIFELKIDGIVGPITWRRLMEEANSVSPPTSPEIPTFPGSNLSMGSSGENVRLIQQAINTIAPCHPGRLWILTVDGQFGQMTRDAIFSFQSVFNMPITGVVNQATWDRLMQEAANVSANGCGGSGTTPQIPSFPGNLSVGSSGSNVRLVQQAINTIAPCHPGRLWILTVDGQFGNMTRDAIFSFQSVFGLPITGVVNQATWDKLMREAADVSANGCGGGGTTPQIPVFPGTNFDIGASGSNVSLIQKAINMISPCYPGQLWILIEDGYYGNMTRNAIFEFQSIFGLRITGVVNKATWDKLMQEEANVSANGCGGGGTTPQIPVFPGSDLRVGSTGSNVRLIQGAINTIAPCHPGRLWILSVDGQFGNMTRDAIFSFQSVFGMPITGVVNEATWNRLMQEAARVSVNGCGRRGKITKNPALPDNSSIIGCADISGISLKQIASFILVNEFLTNRCYFLQTDVIEERDFINNPNDN